MQKQQMPGMNVGRAVVLGRVIERNQYSLNEFAAKTLESVPYRRALEDSLAAATVKKRDPEARRTILLFATSLTYNANFRLEKGGFKVDGEVERAFRILAKDDDQHLRANVMFLARLIGVYGGDISGIKPMVFDIAKTDSSARVRRAAEETWVWTSKKVEDVVQVVAKSSALCRRWAYENGIKLVL